MRPNRAWLALALTLAACGGSETFLEKHPELAQTSAPVATAPPPQAPPSSTAPLAVATTPATTPEPPQPTCGLTLPTRLGPDCQFLFPIRVTATSSAASATDASDGDTCTVWSATDAIPQSITIDLGTPTDLDAFVLVPEMATDGQVTHRIEVSDDGRTFQPAHRIEGPMRSRAPFDMVLPRRERTRFVRVRTEASPSPVAWREIALVRCGTRHGARP